MSSSRSLQYYKRRGTTRAATCPSFREKQRSAPTCTVLLVAVVLSFAMCFLVLSIRLIHVYNRWRQRAFVESGSMGSTASYWSHRTAQSLAGPLGCSVRLILGLFHSSLILSNMAANGTPSRSGIAGTKRKRFPHGNYTGYYATRYGLSDRTEASGLRDPRLDLLRTEWFEGKRCLDVGCNEGDLTLALVLRFRPCRMVGLDIDGKLVDRARKALETHIRIASTEVQRKERVHDETRERDACAERDTNSLARPAGTSSTTQPCAVPPGAHASGSETDAGSSLKESTRYKRGTSCLQPDPNLDHGRSGPLDVGSLPLADCNVACSEKAPRNGEDVSSDRSGAASDGKAVTCNGEAVVCNGEAVVCNGEAVVCNGEKVEGDGRAAPCSGKGVARDGRRAFKGEGDASNGEGEFARGGREDVPSGDDPGKQAAALVTENAKGESAKAPDWDRERSEPSLDYDGRRTRNDRRSSSGPEAQARATSRSGAMMLAGCVVSFQREDFATEMHNDHGYDVVSLFSVVKWIHLNGGDDAIRRVFRKACALLKPGGRLIMEPQPWKSYSKSARQHGTPRARAQVSAIKIRPSDFPSLLTGEVREGLGQHTGPDVPALNTWGKRFPGGIARVVCAPGKKGANFGHGYAVAVALVCLDPSVERASYRDRVSLMGEGWFAGKRDRVIRREVPPCFR